MSRRSWSSRVVLWTIACALVLKAAVPMFAAGAAHLRGVPVAEVCTVYGVALPSALQAEHAHHGHHGHGDRDGHEDHSKHAATHSGDHCALTALAALALPDTMAPAIATIDPAAPSLQRITGTTPRDAAATWAARLKHGPPRSV